MESLSSCVVESVESHRRNGELERTVRSCEGVREN